jgi:hypothetical protein
MNPQIRFRGQADGLENHMEGTFGVRQITGNRELVAKFHSYEHWEEFNEITFKLTYAMDYYVVPTFNDMDTPKKESEWLIMVRTWLDRYDATARDWGKYRITKDIKEAATEARELMIVTQLSRINR